MSVRNCELCKFYCATSAQIGECRLNPPVGIPVDIMRGQLVSFWPPVTPTQWCGKWEQGSLLTVPDAKSVRAPAAEGRQ